MMDLTSLYLGPNAKKGADAFFTSNEERILSLLDDDISLDLTRFCLGDTISEERKALFSALQLIYGRSVSESGMRIVSLYPLFGTGKERKKPYPREFFPFLTAILQKGDYTTRSTAPFPSLFPALGEEKAKEVSLLALDAFLELGIATKSRRRWKLDGKAAASFLALDEVSRLSYILYPSSPTERIKAAKALDLYLNVNGIAVEEWEEVSRLVGTFSGIEIPLETLKLFSLLDDEDGILVARDIQGERFSSPIVSSDFVLSYRGSSNLPLYRIAEPLVTDQLTQWTITKRSVKGALDSGMNMGEIIELLDKFSLYTTPSTLIQRINGWTEQYSKVSIRRATILESDERTAEIIANLPKMKPYIVSRASDTFFLMDGEREDEWRELLSSMGLDMLPETKGPRFQDEGTEVSFQKTSTFLDMPRHREIPYDKDTYRNLLSSAKTLLERSAIASHCAWSNSPQFKLQNISGLYFQEKLSAIEKAIGNKDKIHVVYADGKEDILTPLSVDKANEEEPVLIAEEGSFRIGLFWKTSTIPGLINRVD